MNPSSPEEPESWTISRDSVAESSLWESRRATRRATNSRNPGACPVQRAYPWLLFTSTGVAALFCFMYLSKPVITPHPGPLVPLGPTAAATAAAPAAPAIPAAEAFQANDAPESPSLLPASDRLPGEFSATLAAAPQPAVPGRTLPPPAADSPYEETNLRIQHVLSAETADGAQSRIILDVPVLYESRQLRWTARESREARELLIRLVEHQEKTRSLRDEGAILLDAWNSLIERGIPASELRADSPTLPANQAAAAASPRPAGFDTGEAIRIQNPQDR